MTNFKGQLTEHAWGDSLRVTRTISNIPGGDRLLKAWFVARLQPVTLSTPVDDSDVATDGGFIIEVTESPTAAGQIVDNGASDNVGSLYFDISPAQSRLQPVSSHLYYGIKVLTFGGFPYTPELGILRGKPNFVRRIS